MKIALLAPFEETVPPGKYGGSELVVYNLAKALVQQGHNVTLYASGDSKTPAKLVPVVESALRNQPAIRNARLHEAFTYMGLATAIKHIQTRNYDILHNHLGWPFFVLQDFVNCPVVTTLHNSLAHEYKRSVEERFMFEQFPDSPLISISKSQRRAQPDLNYVATVYNGIDVESFRFNDKPEDYLVFLGRFSPEKGPDRAIKLALRTGHRLVMAGKINDFEQEYFRKRILPKIDGEQITFIGEVDHKQKVALLRNAKALLSPLRWNEPFGLTTVEAMACGTPVISVNRGSLPELVIHRKTGYLNNTLRDMVRSIYNVHKLDRRACRKHVEENFSARKMAEGYLDAYADLIASERKAWKPLMRTAKRLKEVIPPTTLGKRSRISHS